MSMGHEEIDHQKAYQEFRERHGVHFILAVSGGAQTGIPGLPYSHQVVQDYVKNLNDRIRKVIRDCLCQFRSYGIAVMTSGTQNGVPRIATEEAKELGLRTIFVYPWRARKYRMKEYNADLDLVIGSTIGDSEWGDDSPVFAKLLDAMLVIGGATGTLLEATHVFKINESAINHKGESGVRVKYVVPIRGFGGTSEMLHFLCFRDEVGLACMPHESVYTGQRAGELLFLNTDVSEWYNE